MECGLHAVRPALSAWECACCPTLFSELWTPVLHPWHEQAALKAASRCIMISAFMQQGHPASSVVLVSTFKIVLSARLVLHIRHTLHAGNKVSQRWKRTGAAVNQGRDDVSKGRQREVDLCCLFEAVACGPRLALPLTTSQIYQVELAHAHVVGSPVSCALNGDCEDRV